MKNRTKRRTLLVVGLAIVATVGATAAGAITTIRQGSTSDQLYVAHSSDASISNNVAFTDVPNVLVKVTVPAGERRMLLARFSAESACGGATGWCPVRIVYQPVL